MSKGGPALAGLSGLFTTPRVTFLIVFAVLGSVTVIHDPDFYFHLVAGDYILAQRSLPHVDVFSFTMAGEPWHMHEWLFEVAVAALHRLGGEAAVVWLIAATGLAALYLLYYAGRAEPNEGLVRLLPLLPVMVLYLPYVTQRPQVITYLLFAVYLSALFALKYRKHRTGLYWLPLWMVIWVNSHGGYLLGIAFLGLFSATEWWLWWRAGKPASGRAALGVLARVAGLCALASLVNPYFIAQWWFPFELMNREAMGVISEWRAPDFSDPYVQGYLLCVVLFIGRYLSLKKRPDLTEWLLPGALILASFTAVRHIPLALLVMLPFFLRTLGRPTRLPDGFMRHRHRPQSRDLGARENLFNAILLGVVVALLFVLSPRLQTGQQRLKQAILPVEAVDFLERENFRGRLFNQYRYGGYLLYRRYPEQRVFIDIRADMYGDAMMRDYSAIFFAAKGWQSLFERYRFDAVLCEREAPLVQALLKRGGFRVAYRDENNVVLLRNGAKAG